MNPSPAPSKEDEKKVQDSSISIGSIIGIVIGIVAFIALAYFFSRRRTVQTQQTQRVQPQQTQQIINPRQPSKTIYPSIQQKPVSKPVQRKEVLQKQLDNVNSLKAQLQRQKDIRNSNIQMNMGRYLIEQGKTKEGEEMFRKAFPSVPLKSAPKK